MKKPEKERMPPEMKRIVRWTGQFFSCRETGRERPFNKTPLWKKPDTGGFDRVDERIQQHTDPAVR